MRVVVASVVLALVGCGTQAPPPRKARAEALSRQLPGRLGVDPATMPEASPHRDAGPHQGSRPAPAGSSPHTRVLVILDTVRADHTSLCGYGRPTTPVLEALAQRPGAVHTCDAITPGTWTIPSHASMFTGLAPQDHGLLRKGMALDEAHETLAEKMSEAGRRTILVSANPVLKAQTGLHRGFGSADVADRLVSPYRGPALAQAVRARLQEAGQAPVLLVVNIFDAHDPYPSVPEGHPWLTAQDRVAFPTRKRLTGHPFWRFLSGQLRGDARTAWLRSVTDGYDRGVQLADERLGEVLDALRDAGRMSDTQVVVTSDHGENLGEHDLVRHDGPPWQSVTRVPLVVWSTDATPVALPDPMSVTDVFHLLATGRPPDAPTPVRSMSILYADPDPMLPFETAAARWLGGSRKLLWRDGKGTSAYGLLQDPMEEAPQEASASEQALMDAEAMSVQRARQAAMDRERDPELGALLEKLGYVDGSEEEEGAP